MASGLLISQARVLKSHGWGFLNLGRVLTHLTTSPHHLSTPEGHMPPKCIYTIMCVSQGNPKLPHIQGWRPFSHVRFWHSSWNTGRDKVNVERTDLNALCREQDGPPLSPIRTDLERRNTKSPHEAAVTAVTHGAPMSFKAQCEDPSHVLPR